MAVAALEGIAVGLLPAEPLRAVRCISGAALVPQRPAAVIAACCFFGGEELDRFHQMPPTAHPTCSSCRFEHPRRVIWREGMGPPPSIIHMFRREAIRWPDQARKFRARLQGLRAMRGQAEIPWMTEQLAERGKARDDDSAVRAACCSCAIVDVVPEDFSGNCCSAIPADALTASREQENHWPSGVHGRRLAS
jgi:hypothetical protein